MASGYDLRTLTYSAEHVLESSKDYASSLGEAITPLIDRIPPKDSTNFTGSNLHLEKEGGVLQRQNTSEGVAKIV